MKWQTIYLLESNVSGVLPEALSAKVQAIFANKSMTVGTSSAAMKQTNVKYA